MNNIKRTLQKTFKPRKRRAAIGGIIAIILVMVIVIAGVAMLSGVFFDVADTASIIEAIDISNPSLYSEQGFVSVQVKNNGNTGIEDIYATLLVDDTTDCDPGTVPLLVTTNKAVLTAAVTAGDNVPGVKSLDPGESITVSGGLRNAGAITVSGAGDTDAATIAVITAFECDGGEIEDRGEYILQINGHSDGDVISKTILLRAR